MKTQNRGLDLSREKISLDGKEWKFGATSAPALITIPKKDRLDYLPPGEIQVGREDMQDCASRAPINALEAIFSYALDKNLLKPENEQWLRVNGYVQNRRVIFSDAFIAIKSGTTRNGNSLKDPIRAINKCGLIPKTMLPLDPDMTFDEYHYRGRITLAMEQLAGEFLSRFTINYEQVDTKDLATLAEKEMIVVAGYAWPKPRTGIYRRTDGPFNHAFLIVQPAFKAFDNYLDDGKKGDFVKQLAADYAFFDYGYRLYLSEERTPSRGVLLAIVDTLKTFISYLSPKVGSRELLTRIAELRTTLNTLLQKQTLHQAAIAHLGRDASPYDRAADEVGCAESVSEIIKTVVPDFPVITGTYALWTALKVHPRFRQVSLPMPGAIIISPTGTQPKWSLVKHGHVGICGMGDVIMSNSSFDSKTTKKGHFEQNYTTVTWHNRWGKAGFPTYYYQLIN